MRRYRTFIAGFTLLCLTLSISSCYSNRLITKQELVANPQDKIITVYTADTIYDFDEMNMGRIIEDTLIVGRLESGSLRSISMDRVSLVAVRKVNIFRSIMAGAAVVCTAATVLLAYGFSQMDQ